VDKETQKLLDIVDRFSGTRVVVWGDFILDAYLLGTTRRVSREAPVLILKYASSEFALGGAGNALRNLWALGAKPIPVGLVGADESGENIIDFLRTCRIPTSGLIVRRNHQTPVKTRVMAGEENTRKQQILRIDRESEAPRTAEFREALRARLLRALPRSEALLVSDYNYHTVQPEVFQALRPALRRSLVPVTLDSRFRLLDFPGVTIATPNEPEVESALKLEICGREDELLQAGRSLLNRLRSPALLITRGSRGMALFERGAKPRLLPVQGTTDIVDVTGAGDTVISVLTLALACGATFAQAAGLANHAGGLVVMKKGTAVVTPDEIRKSVTES
jgi:rfaE bifunctional protein kinase chain/domain